MRVLVWQWGRRGAGPRFAVELARGFAGLDGVASALCLTEGAEIWAALSGDLAGEAICLPGYADSAELLRLLAHWPDLLRRLDAVLTRARPDLAVCAMPGILDPALLRALHRRGVPSVMIAHDAVAHAGDTYRARIWAQRVAARQAGHVFALGPAVAARLGVPALFHPPFDFGPMPPVRAHGGRLRVLSFGRLLAYKGLDLLADVLGRLDPARVERRVVGLGPEGAALAALRRVARVENRWVAEAELPALLAWADVVLLTHAAASQSGLAAAAWGAGRFVVAPDIPGLAEQLADMQGAMLARRDAGALADAVLWTNRMGAPLLPDHAALWARLARSVLAGIGMARPPSPIAAVGRVRALT